MEDRQVVVYASLNRRMFAACIDTMIIFMIFAPLLNYLDFFIYNGRPPAIVAQEFFSLYSSKNDSIDVSGLFERFSRENIWYKMLFLYTATFSILGAYTIFFWHKLGATPAKYLFGMRIVNKSDLGKPSLFRLFIRFMSYIISFFPLFIGFMMIGLDKKKQGLHDKIAGTLVLVTKHDFGWLKKIRFINKP
jgi:uncharacterized RDD family membrane protein YckC